MKKRIFSSIILAMGLLSMTYAQTVQEEELAVVYYMPQTQLAITIDYEEVSVAPGPFYLYADRYLGVKDVTTEAQTRYKLTNLQVAPHTVADHTRAYKVVASAGSEMQWLSLTAEGLLYGYNVPMLVENEAAAVATSPVCSAAETLMPLLEEQMVASSIAKMAEGAAKQIYHIREMRISLLAGDVEHTPADGQAMQLVLQELDKREQMLAELFIGTRTVKRHTHTILYTPTHNANEHIIARFSQFSGMVAADDLSGEPIRLTLVGHRQTYLPEQPQDAKSKILPSQLYYNLPGMADITISYGKDMRLASRLPIAQFGVAVPIAKNLLLQKKTPRIYFNTQTGNILSIEQ